MMNKTDKELRRLNIGGADFFKRVEVTGLDLYRLINVAKDEAKIEMIKKFLALFNVSVNEVKCEQFTPAKDVVINGNEYDLCCCGKYKSEH